jgi:hypothetical protein
VEPVSCATTVIEVNRRSIERANIVLISFPYIVSVEDLWSVLLERFSDG